MAEAQRLVATSEAESRPGLTLVLPGHPDRIDFDRLADGWQHALDGASGALDASGRAYSNVELVQRRHTLANERSRTSRLLATVAATAGTRHVPWLSAIPMRPSVLGLPDGTRACIFDLDGVLTDSAVVHSAAWAEVFDDVLLGLSERAHRHFVPFDPEGDYLAFIDGKPRLEGIHSFLRSRGIQLPEGRASDSADADTAYGIARRKSEALARTLRRRGVTALPGTRRYLEAAGRAGIGRAVVSGSATTRSMLAIAGLDTLVDVSVDAESVRTEHLRSRPAPDGLLSACTHLGVPPARTAAFTRSPDGVAAGKAAGVWVVGIGDAHVTERLAGFGADRLAPSLLDLLDSRLRGSAT